MTMLCSQNSPYTLHTRLKFLQTELGTDTFLFIYPAGTMLIIIITNDTNN